MLGKIGGRRRRGRQRMRWLDSITDSMDMSLSKLHTWWWSGRPGVLCFIGSQRLGHDWATELNWTPVTAFIIVVQGSLCPTLCDTMDCSKPGFLVLDHLLELAETHVCWVGDAIQPSHLLASPSPPAFYLFQHQGPLQWVTSSYQVAKLLEFLLQHQSFQYLFRVDLLKDGLVASPCSPRNSQESSLTP